MHYVKMRPHLVSRNFDAANDYLEQTKKSFYKSEKNRLLFYMDKAMVLHHGGRYEESNVFLERGKIAAEELWTESVRIFGVIALKRTTKVFSLNLEPCKTA